MANELFTLTDATEKRFVGLFWGASGTGKTILAATAPKPILYLGWDIEGWQSVQNRTDFYVINLADMGTDVVEHFTHYNSPAYKDLTAKVEALGIKTIISDSLTKFVSRALERATVIGPGYAQKGEKVSLFNPGWTGYRIRTALLHAYITNMGLFCSKFGLNNILIGHEDQPKTIGDGENQRILFQSLRLGGDSGFEVPIDVREVWHFAVDGDNGKISLRPFPVTPGSAALVKPMKSTMFDTNSLKTIIWDKDSADDRLDIWLEKWKTKGVLTAKDL